MQAMETEHLFSFTWCPTANDPDVDYSGEPKTRVDFELLRTPEGTRLVLSESGFNAIADREARAKAFEVNSQGWDIQARNITEYVEC